MEWLSFFTLGWGRAVGLYVLLQVGAVATLKGPARLASLYPVAPVSVLFVVSLQGYKEGSNLWPLGMIFLIPCTSCALLLAWSIGLLLRFRGWSRMWAVGPFVVAGVYALATRLGKTFDQGSLIPSEWRFVGRDVAIIGTLWLGSWLVARQMGQRWAIWRRWAGG